MKVSRLKSVFDSKPRMYPLQTIALEMRRGHTTLHDLHEDSSARTIAEATTYARELLGRRGPAAYNIIKTGMPQFFPSVVCTGRSKEHIQVFTGFIPLEYDDSDVDTAHALALAHQNPHVVMAWHSLSGKPKFLVRVAPRSVDGEALSLSTFPHAWVTAMLPFEEIGKADPTSTRPLQLQNICYDPDLYLNLDALPLDWSVDAEALRETVPLGFELSFALMSELGEEYLDALERMEYNDEGVGSERLPCPFTTHEHDGWGLHSNACRVIQHGDHDVELQCFKCGKNKRYSLSTSVPKRYHLNMEHSHDLSDIDAEREENGKVLQDWLQKIYNSDTKELLVLGSAAGTGKTTATITTVDSLFYVAKTTEEADQVFQTLFDAGEDVIRHRPRMYNRAHKDLDGNDAWDTLQLGLGAHERPCIQPEACNLLAERGSPTYEVCIRCRLYTDCLVYGYLSQDEKERNAQKVVYAWDEAVACDHIYSDRLKRICTADDILILDEVNPANLTQRRIVTRDMIFDLKERFRDPNTLAEYEALNPLFDLISTASTPEAFLAGLKAHLDAISDISELDTKLAQFPVGHVFKKVEGEPYQFTAYLVFRGREVTVPVVDVETTPDTPVFEVNADTQLEIDTCITRLFPLSFLIKVGLATLSDPPMRYNRLLSDMETFLAEHSNVDTAPFTFDAKKQMFEFHLKPTLNHRRTIFNTASDPDNLIAEAYRDTDINITHHTGTPPAWKTDLVFQISTGNYMPRQSLILRTEDGKLHLKPRAQQLIDDYVMPSVDAGLKVLMVAPKAFLRIDVLKKLKDRGTVELINHHHAEGRNDFQDFDIVFIFHYEPNHNVIPPIAKRTYRNAEIPLDFTREKQTVTVGSVSFEKVVYVDKRVQAVYNRECRQRLMQSGMRLRPNIHEGKILVYFTSEPVDVPVTPVPFTPKDAILFYGDWMAFAAALKAEQEVTLEQRIAIGISERTAYRRTEVTRKTTKAVRDAEICRRFGTLKQSKKQIAADMGISQDTVKRILETQPI